MVKSDNTYDIMVERGENMRVDDQFMEEVGLGEMPAEEKQTFMKHAEEELEVRVGQNVGMELSDEQMREFDQIEDISVAADWLERNAPNYREIVEKVYETFKQEIMNERQRILSA